MKIRNTRLLFLTLIAAFIAIVPARADLIPNIISEPIRQLFSGLPQDYVRKFILAIAVFTIFYAVMMQFDILGSKTGKRGSIPITLSIALALLTTLAIPDTITQALFEWYGGIFSMLLFLAPLIGILFYLYKSKQTDQPGLHFLRALVFGLMTVLFSWNLTQGLFLPQGVTGDVTVKDILQVAALATFIMFIIEIFRGFGAMKSSSSAVSTGERISSSDGDDDSAKEVQKMEDDIQKYRNEEEAAKLREKEKEEARKLEELGRAIGQLTIQGQNLLDRINEGLAKLSDVMNREDFYRIISEVNQKIVQVMKADIAELRRHIDGLTKDENNAEFTLKRLIAEKERELNISKRRMEELGNQLEVSTQQFKIEKDKELKNLFNMRNEILGGYINLLRTMLPKIQEELNNAKQLASPQREKYNEFQKLIKTSVQGIEKGIKDLEQALMELMKKISDPKVRGEKHATMQKTIEEMAIHINNIHKSYAEFDGLRKQIIAEGQELLRVVGTGGKGQTDQLDRYDQELARISREIQGFARKSSEEEKKKVKAKDDLTKAEVTIDNASRSGKPVDEAALRRQLKNLYDEKKGYGYKYPGAIRDRIDKDISDIEDKLKQIEGQKRLSKLEKSTKGKPDAQREVLEAELNQLQRKLRDSPVIGRAAIERQIKIVEKKLKDLP